MEKVKLSVEMEPELRRRVKLAATSRDQTIREWIVNAICHELEGEDEDGLIKGQERTKPLGLKNPPRPRSGRSVSDAVIEDRRSGW
jgi:hypothetical protein